LKFALGLVRKSSILGEHLAAPLSFLLQPKVVFLLFLVLMFVRTETHFHTGMVRKIVPKPPLLLGQCKDIHLEFLSKTHREVFSLVLTS